jgi:hypothetical protein
LCPLTELEIFKNVKIFSGLSLALWAAFQSAYDKSAQKDHSHDS